MQTAVKITKNRYENILVTRRKIVSSETTNDLNIVLGDYSEISFHNAHNTDYASISKILAQEIKNVTHISLNDTVLVVGMGNAKILTDSLGPVTIEKIEATRGLSVLYPNDFKDRVKVCAISPGVIGKSGVSVQETIEMFSEKLNPELIIVIDALDVHSIEQIGHTIKIGNAGFRSNSRIRLDLTKEALRRPVITIGIPLVTDASTIANDIIEVLLPSVDTATSL